MGHMRRPLRRLLDWVILRLVRRAETAGERTLQRQLKQATDTYRKSLAELNERLAVTERRLQAAAESSTEQLRARDLRIQSLEDSNGLLKQEIDSLAEWLERENSRKRADIATNNLRQAKALGNIKETAEKP